MTRAPGTGGVPSTGGRAADGGPPRGSPALTSQREPTPSAKAAEQENGLNMSSVQSR